MHDDDDEDNEEYEDNKIAEEGDSANKIERKREREREREQERGDRGGRERKREREGEREREKGMMRNDATYARRRSGVVDGTKRTRNTRSTVRANLFSM